MPAFKPFSRAGARVKLVAGSVRCCAKGTGGERLTYEGSDSGEADRVRLNRRQSLAVLSLVPWVAGPMTLPPMASAGTRSGWYSPPKVSPEEAKTIFLTGASSGIGFAAAGALAAAGHHIVAVCRTEDKARQACQDLQARYGPLQGSVEPEVCELASLASVRKLAERWSSRPVDVLCLNAGAQFVGQKEARRTEDGLELTVGVNHIAHFLLARLMLPSLEQAAQPARIVVTTSEVHNPESAGGKIGPGATLGNLSGLAAGPSSAMISGGPFDADKAYKDSKLCNILFAREFSRRLAAAGSKVTVNAFGPGLITRSGFFRSASGPFIGVFDFITNDVLGVAETVQGGGDCLAYMAVDSSLAGRTGLYFNNDTAGIPLLYPSHKFSEQRPSEEAQNADEARVLWELSSHLVGLEA